MVFLFHSRWIIVETIVNYTYNLSIFMLPIPSGIPPLSSLLCTNRSVNFVSCVIDGGMGPVMNSPARLKRSTQSFVSMKLESTPKMRSY